LKKILTIHFDGGEVDYWLHFSFNWHTDTRLAIDKKGEINPYVTQQIPTVRQVTTPLHISTSMCVAQPIGKE